MAFIERIFGNKLPFQLVPFQQGELLKRYILNMEIFLSRMDRDRHLIRRRIIFHNRRLSKIIPPMLNPFDGTFVIQMPDIESRNTEISQNGSVELRPCLFGLKAGKFIFCSRCFSDLHTVESVCRAHSAIPLRFPRNNKTDRITRQINRIPTSPALR